MNRNQLTTVLKINGIDMPAADDVIREVLLKANYSESEVNTALIVLRESEVVCSTRIEGLHSVMYSDTGLKSSEVTNLLGIDIEIEMPRSSRSKYNTISTKDGFVIIFLATLLAAVVVVSYMFFYKVGFFYSSL